MTKTHFEKNISDSVRRRVLARRMWLTAEDLFYLLYELMWKIRFWTRIALEVFRERPSRLFFVSAWIASVVVSWQLGTLLGVIWIILSIGYFSRGMAIAIRQAKRAKQLQALENLVDSLSQDGQASEPKRKDHHVR